jgi:hypothetical protein
MPRHHRPFGFKTFILFFLVAFGCFALLLFLGHVSFTGSPMTDLIIGGVVSLFIAIFLYLAMRNPEAAFTLLLIAVVTGGIVAYCALIWHIGQQDLYLMLGVVLVVNVTIFGIMIANKK